MHAALETSSPLSPFSADHKSLFWRSLARSYAGIISFAANCLEDTERFHFFACLVKLERFLANAEPWERVLDDVIQESSRSSVLYSLLSSDSDVGRGLVDILRQSIAATKRRGVTNVERLFLPRPILAYVGSSVNSFRSHVDRDSLDDEHIKSSRKRQILLFDLKELMRQKKLKSRAQQRVRPLANDDDDDENRKDSWLDVTVSKKKAERNQTKHNSEPFDHREDRAVRYLTDLHTPARIQRPPSGVVDKK